MVATGETVDLAEWIIDDTCLVLRNFVQSYVSNNLLLMIEKYNVMNLRAMSTSFSLKPLINLDY